MSGPVTLRAAIAGTVVHALAAGAIVRRGEPVVIVEAMKMEHPAEASVDGVVASVAVSVGASVAAGQILAVVRPELPERAGDTETPAAPAPDPLTHLRADLAEVQRRHALTLDAARPDAVARRRKTGQRTARENVDDLLDPGSFLEYGALALAAMRARHSVDELIAKSPADGLIAGVGTINAAEVGVERARAMVLAYDYTVFAGTQGGMGHKKLDRMLALAMRWRLPVVLFAEGGGGRPNDTDMPWADTRAWLARGLAATPAAPAPRWPGGALDTW